MYNIGAQFKRIRLEKNLTQKQVAEGIGVAEQQYQRYEYEKVEPSASKLIALADYYDISLDYLTGRSDDPARRRRKLF